ncbi:hypothetical protein APHAL10511_007896, partial [Amanita phalloides]
MAWGDPEEQRNEHECGNAFAKDWHDEVHQVIEKAMAKYWQEPNALCATSGPMEMTPLDANTMESEFDRHCRTLNQQSAQSSSAGRWAAELCCYLSDLPVEVMKDTDVIQWWQ